mgnify:CR=1 FL=1
MMHTRRSYNGQLDQKEIENHFIVVQRELENWAYKKANASPKNSKNDFRIVGQETIALEICQDLHWKAPDWIAVPCGNGGNLTALLISLLRMKERKMINFLPGIIVAQTKGANTLVRWAKSGFKDYNPGSFKDSIASAMNIQNPVSFPRIKELRKKFRIEFFDATESDIQETRDLFMGAGANICPQTAVALDAVLEAINGGIVKENDSVIVIGTASGIKFSELGTKRPVIIKGAIEDIEKAVKFYIND